MNGVACQQVERLYFICLGSFTFLFPLLWMDRKTLALPPLLPSGKK